MKKEETNIPILPDYHNCLVNLSNSILARFSTPASANTLKLADGYLEGEYKNIVLLVLDAMGISILEKHLDKNSFFRKHLVGGFDSVYPPTTVAATTSLLSGLYPCEHGWLGWDMYYPKLDKNVTVFTNTDQLVEKEGAVPESESANGEKIWEEASLKEVLPAAQFHCGFTYTPYQNIIDKINTAGGNAYFSMPFMPPFPQDLDAILKRIGELCAAPERKFIYAYWNEPDSTMHRTGTESKESHQVILELEKKIEEFVVGLSDTLLLITADHSHIDCQNLCILDYPKVMEALERMPAMEPRTLNFFVKKEYQDSFPAIIREAFGDKLLLFTKEEVLSGKLFGIGKEREDLQDLIGNYIAVSTSDTALFLTHYEAQTMPGGHAGMTEEEYKIPLIVIEKNR